MSKSCKLKTLPCAMEICTQTISCGTKKSHVQLPLISNLPALVIRWWILHTFCLELNVIAEMFIMNAVKKKLLWSDMKIKPCKFIIKNWLRPILLSSKLILLRQWQKTMWGTGTPDALLMIWCVVYLKIKSFSLFVPKNMKTLQSNMQLLNKICPATFYGFVETIPHI